MATGQAERETACDMLGEVAGKGRIIDASDKVCDTMDFVRKTRSIDVAPHVARNTKNSKSVTASCPTQLNNVTA
jgi:hypothetical protein